MFACKQVFEQLANKHFVQLTENKHSFIHLKRRKKNDKKKTILLKALIHPEAHTHTSCYHVVAFFAFVCTCVLSFRPISIVLLLLRELFLCIWNQTLLYLLHGFFFPFTVTYMHFAVVVATAAAAGVFFYIYILRIRALLMLRQLLSRKSCWTRFLICSVQSFATFSLYFTNAISLHLNVNILEKMELKIFNDKKVEEEKTGDYGFRMKRNMWLVVTIALLHSLSIKIKNYSNNYYLIIAIILQSRQTRQSHPQDSVC